MTRIIKDRKELEKRLLELSETEYTGEISLGAMCYCPLGRDKEEYFCPKCGKVTMQENYTVWAIEDIKEIVIQIKQLGYDAHLSEEEFCIYCGKNAKEYKNFYSDLPIDEFTKLYRHWDENKPELIFQIRIEKTSEYNIARSNIVEDYRCTLEFLKGQDHYLNDYDATETIHDNVRILQKMLGIGMDIPVPPEEAPWWDYEDNEEDDE